MKANTIIKAAAAITLIVAGGPTLASTLVPAEDGIHVEGYDLSEYGIAPASWTNFENDVKVKVVKKGKQGSRGTMLLVRGKKGSGNYFNLEPTENFTIKGSSYKLKARFDADGNLIRGRVKINGIIKTDAGKVRGRLLTARLGDLLDDNDYAFTDKLIGFNTYNVKCNDIIESISPGGCESAESVYISLDKSLEDITHKYRSSGLAVTGSVAASAVPVPAAAWLFGSGLLGLAGLARRRK